jgi:hypothetical protein
METGHETFCGELVYQVDHVNYSAFGPLYSIFLLGFSPDSATCGKLFVKQTPNPLPQAIKSF